MRFSKEYSKLKKEEFTTIRKNAGFYKLGNIYQIITPSQQFKARIIEHRILRTADITEELARSDADCSKSELIAMLERWYGKSFDEFVLLTFKRMGE